MERSAKALCLLFSLTLGVGCDQARGASYYFDQNGATAGFGLTGGGVYSWDNPDSGAVQYWNSVNGGAGTFSRWSSLTGTDNIAIFTGVADGYTVNLQDDVWVGGIRLNTSLNSAKAVVIQAASTKKITLAPGAAITNVAGSGRHLIFGDHIDLVGDILLDGNGTVGIRGVGNKYTGTITLAGLTANATLSVASDHRYAATTKMVINQGSISLVDATSATIAELKGSGGSVLGVSNSTLILDQNSNTEWAGVLGSNTAGTASTQALSFEKKGTGTLSLTGITNHSLNGKVTVHDGALYIGGNLVQSSLVTGVTNGVFVKDGALFGGTTSSDKRVYLEAAGSQLSPGMLGEVGTLTLANGLTASSGGTFNFAFNGLDELGEAANSKIVMSAGVLTLGGVLTANFTDLGLGDMDAGQSYTFTIFEADGIGGSLSLWTVGDLPTGWVAGPEAFSIDGNALRITLHVIPEPSTIALTLLSLVALVPLYRSTQKEGHANR